MCVPVSVVTAGQVSGCHGICHLWPHITALVALCGGLIFNFRSRIFGSDKKLEQGNVQ